MPDNASDQAVVSPQLENVPAEIKQGLDQQMKLALNGGIVAEEPPKEEIQTASAIVDPFQPFKDKFGYQSAEDAMREIEELRGFKANPPIPAITFENEESEKLFRAWQAGKIPEVYSYLENQQRIEKYLTKEVTPDTAADIVKVGMALKYKDLTPDEINYKFNKQFAVPPKPIQGPEEEEPVYRDRVSAWQAVVDDKKMELMIEAKLAKPELESAKTKLVFPEIEQAVDEGYVQYKKALEENQRLAAETQEAYKTFTPKSAETKINFKDETNKIDFTYQYEPDQASFARDLEVASDINKFWGLFFDKDGKPDRPKFLKAIHYALNEQAILMSAMNQAKNATIKALLPDNSQGGLVRQLVQTPQEPTEVEKEMERRGIKRGV